MLKLNIWHTRMCGQTFFAKSIDRYMVTTVIYTSLAKIGFTLVEPKNKVKNDAHGCVHKRKEKENANNKPVST